MCLRLLHVSVLSLLLFFYGGYLGFWEGIILSSLQRFLLQDHISLYILFFIKVSCVHYVRTMHLERHSFYQCQWYHSSWIYGSHQSLFSMYDYLKIYSKFITVFIYIQRVMLVLIRVIALLCYFIIFKVL